MNFVFLNSHPNISALFPIVDESIQAGHAFGLFVKLGTHREVPQPASQLGSKVVVAIIRIHLIDKLFLLTCGDM